MIQIVVEAVAAEPAVLMRKMHVAENLPGKPTKLMNKRRGQSVPMVFSSLILCF